MVYGIGRSTSPGCGILSGHLDSGISPILVLVVINVATDGGLGRVPAEGRAPTLGLEYKEFFDGREGARSIWDSKKSDGTTNILGSLCKRLCSGA